MQRRKLIRTAFFQDFFYHTVQVFEHRFRPKRWKSFRLWAVDGTGLRLPDFDDIGEAFGWHDNQHSTVASTRWLLTFDVLNQLIVDVQLHGREQAEVTVAYPLIEELPQDVLAIYDRGYASYAVAYLHLLYGSHCVIRLPKTFGPKITDFIQSNENERIIEANLGDRSASALRKMGFPIRRRQTFPLRLIRVDLPGGEVEILLTTLLHRRYYHHRHFAELYHRRWGVETAFFVLKSYFQAAHFSSYTMPGVAQDIWSLFALYNLQSILQLGHHKQLQRIKERRRYTYQLNRNVGMGLIKRSLHILLSEERRWYARTKALLDELLRHLEPVRPRPNRERNRRILRGNDRHIYEHNYRSTM